MYPINSQAEGVFSNSEFLFKIKNILDTIPLINTNKNIEYYNIPAAFDIEVSSFYCGERKPENKRAIMYIWQFGIGDIVTIGRTWEEFISFLDILAVVMELSIDRRLIVYVHNLPYEFQFIRKRFSWDNVFILDKRKPVYARREDGIEFRCSLKLAGGKSLENIGKDLVKYKVKKMVGFLDYNQIRTSITPLTKKELKYCENDIRVLLCYIQEKIEQDGNITNIPLTNTGYVREYCRKACYKKWREYRNIIQNLTIDVDEYSQLKRAFQGGFTHANAHHVADTRHELKALANVGSHDFGSSYPACMVLEKFPMSKSKLINGNIQFEQLKYYLIHNCCLFDVEFHEIESKMYQEHPISRYQCWICENAIVDNGRIVLAERIATTITEQDFFTYCEAYTFSEVIIGNFRIYEKNYLPKRFVRSILDLYERKTILKGNKDEEINYTISKNMINAGYGMMVTDPVREEIAYENDDFVNHPQDIQSALDKYNSNIRRFLFYPWGVWVTAYARANLFSGIIECGEDYIYSDTDSLKTLNTEKHEEYFKKYNEQIFKKIERASKYHGIDPKMFSPSTLKGVEKPIGVWEYDGNYEKFKTLGAKRYLTFRHEHMVIEDLIDNKPLTVELTIPTYELTVAGANKKKSMVFLRKTGDPFGNFNDGLTIPPEYSGRLILTYIDEETEGDVIDMYGNKYHYHELSVIHMEPSEYNLSISEEFERYLKGLHDYGE